ncbi:hypothetical protein AVEN_178063-1 [Araneus ventricosus]|uniref:Uncharacterized protein n=1 Tax=Araneus ventricosus TaxID=182803 RepID=A0A4Y2I4L5_ARAVE|nr:hypothetical protein AVEN_178063-1 [Araneus ventricosus]
MAVMEQNRPDMDFVNFDSELSEYYNYGLESLLHRKQRFYTTMAVLEQNRQNMDLVNFDSELCKYYNQQECLFFPDLSRVLTPYYAFCICFCLVWLKIRFNQRITMNSARQVVSLMAVAIETGYVREDPFRIGGIRRMSKFYFIFGASLRR